MKITITSGAVAAIGALVFLLVGGEFGSSESGSVAPAKDAATEVSSAATPTLTGTMWVLHQFSNSTGTHPCNPQSTSHWYFDPAAEVFTEIWLDSGFPFESFSRAFRADSSVVHVMNPDGSEYLRAEWAIENGRLLLTRVSPLPKTESIPESVVEHYNPETGQVLDSVTFPAVTTEEPSLWEFVAL